MKHSNITKITKAIVAMIALFAMACETKKASFSLLSEENVYEQTLTYQPRKIDILWVVDNSGSMYTSQTKLADNFQSFINRFQTLKFDFHMAVTATDAWKALFVTPSTPTRSTFSLLRDGGTFFDVSAGADTYTHSGVFVLNRNTPDLATTFMNNVKLGARGTGDERAFQSFKATLNDINNVAFRRDDAFLAVIIISDEDDFSHPSYVFNNSQYTNTSLNPDGSVDTTMTLDSVSSYVDFLDQFTKKDPTATIRNYSVSAITIQNQACIDQLATDGFTGRSPGYRYLELADATNGIKGDMCSDYGNTLEIISDSIIAQSSVFPLTRQPVVDSIKIHVNGVLIANNDTVGWTYRAEDNAIVFHGAAIPAAGANISIYFDPIGVKL